VYRRIGTDWILQARLTGDGSFVNGRFSLSVAIDGDTLAVGAGGAWVGGVVSGALFVFRRDATGSWAPDAKLGPGDPRSGSGFGTSVALEGDRLAVGAPFAGVVDPGTGFLDLTGAVYVFDRTEEFWAQAAKLFPTGLAPFPGFHQFGSSVALHENTLVGGAPCRNSFPCAGSAFVFERDGAGSWAQVAKLSSSTPAPGETFGFSVATTGDIVAVGAPFNDDGCIGGFDTCDSGLVYLFARPDAGWSDSTEQARLATENSRQFDTLGWSLSATPGLLAVGAARYRNNGATFVYEVCLSARLPGQFQADRIPNEVRGRLITLCREGKL
jgi:hypothetical protein